MHSDDNPSKPEWLERLEELSAAIVNRTELPKSADGRGLARVR